MTKAEAAERLMLELQAGIDSAQKDGWMSEEEVIRLLLEAEDMADLRIY